jgi:DNA-binding NarL/FixJ family response regulator
LLSVADRAVGATERASAWARVLVVDPHELIGWGLRAVLCGQPWVERCIPVRSAQAALDVAGRYDPHLALVALRVGRTPGLELVRVLRAAHPHLCAALLTHADEAPDGEARAAGASGLVSIGWPAADVVAGVRTLLSGGTLFPAEMAQRRLSRREREVLGLLVTGATNREMGAHLALSPETIKDHTISLYRKLGARNRADAIHRAQRLGLLA